MASRIVYRDTLGSLLFDPNLPDAPLLLDSDNTTGYNRNPQVGDTTARVMAFMVFDAPVTVDELYIVATSNKLGSTNSWTLLGSNDNVTYSQTDASDIWTHTTGNGGVRIQSFPLAIPKTWKYWRFQTVMQGYASDLTAITGVRELRLYRNGNLYQVGRSYGKRRFVN